MKENTISSTGHGTIKNFSNYFFVSEAKKSGDYPLKAVKQDFFFFFNEKKQNKTPVFYDSRIPKSNFEDF